MALDALAESLSAGIGGIICTTVLYPIEIVKNQLQVMTNAGGERPKGAPEPTFRSVGAHIWRLDGLRGLMWGNTPSCIWGFVEKMVYFYSFALLRHVSELISERCPAHHPPPCSSPPSRVVQPAGRWARH